jgi:hypothetical protein
MSTLSPRPSVTPVPALLTQQAAGPGAHNDADDCAMIVSRMLAAHVLARVETNPFFLGCALAAIARRDALDIDALAARVGCTVDNLTRLALYRRPELASNRFGEQVMRIAERTGADPVCLAMVLLEV